MLINRLTVDGKDYFLPDPVAELRDQILTAIQSGGGYVRIPPINGGSGVEILFSPGMPVQWTQLVVGNDQPDTEAAQAIQHEANREVLDNL
ncbi:MAG: hypothetical protein JWM50_2145 [Microbacteriaceae bacterium]|nr:hypothetical protein [Microbacteriaceae bacterium]